MGREIVPRAQRRPATRGVCLKSGSAQALIWLEKSGYSGQGNGRFALTLTRGRMPGYSAVNGTRMTEFPRKITDDPSGAAILIRRLITEQGAAYWHRYLLAFVLMGVSAAANAGSAWILGPVINKAYVDKAVRAMAVLTGVPVRVYILKGAATESQRVFRSGARARPR